MGLTHFYKTTVFLHLKYTGLDKSVLM